MRISGQVFFLLSVLPAYYTLSSKKKPKKIINQIFWSSGQYLEVYFYMSMQSSMRLEIDDFEFLIHAFKIEIWPPKFFPYVCTGKSDVHLQ